MAWVRTSIQATDHEERLSPTHSHSPTKMKEISATYCISKDPSLAVPDVLILAGWLTVASLVLGVGE